jgi:hypothetical protein
MLNLKSTPERGTDEEKEWGERTPRWNSELLNHDNAERLAGGRRDSFKIATGILILGKYLKSTVLTVFKYFLFPCHVDLQLTNSDAMR